MVFQCASLHAWRKAMWRRLIVLPDVLFYNLALKCYRPPDREAFGATLKVQATAPLCPFFRRSHFWGFHLSEKCDNNVNFFAKASSNLSPSPFPKTSFYHDLVFKHPLLTPHPFSRRHIRWTIKSVN